MFVEMSCSCSAAISVDVDTELDNAGWLLASRFASAHVNCGFVSPLMEETQHETTTFNFAIQPDQDS